MLTRQAASERPWEARRRLMRVWMRMRMRMAMVCVTVCTDAHWMQENIEEQSLGDFGASLQIG